MSRWYDPSLGRFTQPDSIIPDPAKVKGYDRYAYVENDPIKFNDPTGHIFGIDDALVTVVVAWTYANAYWLGPALLEGGLVVYSAIDSAAHGNKEGVVTSALAAPLVAAGIPSNNSSLEGEIPFKAADEPLETITAAGETQLFRSMKMGENGQPAVGPSARALGVRTPPSLRFDISVEENGDVAPGQGGMSVVPNDPMNLDSRRKPSSLGGSGKDPVWCISSCDLGPGLQYRQDSKTHGIIEPASTMSIESFQQALADTISNWWRTQFK